jgi:hypothetical protein
MLSTGRQEEEKTDKEQRDSGIHAGWVDWVKVYRNWR